MSRSATGQFRWFATAAEAREYLRTADRTTDNHGDRIAASRRCETYPVPMSLAEGYERFRRKPGDPPYHNGKRGR